MELVRWEPFVGLSRLHNRINDLFDGHVGRARALPSATAGAWLPPVDILESKDAYLIRAELPGMKKEDFSLEVHDGSLTVSGERKLDGLSEDVEYQRSERVHGSIALRMGGAALGAVATICSSPFSRGIVTALAVW